MNGGAQNLRVGDRVRVVGTHTDETRYLLNGLEGEVTGVLNHGAIVALDSDPAASQRVIGAAGAVGPRTQRPQRIIGFSELERIPKT